MKVYLATSGAYSTFRIEYVFAREEDARSYALSDNVLEFDVREGPVEVRTWYTLRWDPDSRSRGNPWEVTEDRDFDGDPARVEHYWGTYGTTFMLAVQGWDLDRVRKVYLEQRARHEAGEAGDGMSDE